MKKFLLITATLLSFTYAMAEEPYMVREGQQWVYEICNFLDNGDHTNCYTFPMTLEFKGDTIINDVSYLKLYRTLSGDVCGLSSYEDGDTVIVIPKGTELIACLREDDVHNVYALYELSYRSQVRNFTTNNFRYNLAEDDPLVFGNFEYHIYHLGASNPTEWYIMNVRLNEYSEQPYFKFAKRVKYENENLLYGINVWCDDNDEMNPIGHFFFNQSFGYYKEASTSVDMGTFISPLGTLRDFRPRVTCQFSHFIVNGKTIYKTSAYNQDLDATVDVNQIVTDLEHNANYWYDLDGHTFTLRPNSPGIYIHQGKKVVVK